MDNLFWLIVYYSILFFKDLYIVKNKYSIITYPNRFLTLFIYDSLVFTNHFIQKCSIIFSRKPKISLPKILLKYKFFRVYRSHIYLLRGITDHGSLPGRDVAYFFGAGDLAQIDVPCQTSRTPGSPEIILICNILFLGPHRKRC